MTRIFFLLGAVSGLVLLAPLPFLVARQRMPSDLAVFHVLSCLAGAVAANAVSTRLKGRPGLLAFASGALPPLMV